MTENSLEPEFQESMRNIYNKLFFVYADLLSVIKKSNQQWLETLKRNQEKKKEVICRKPSREYVLVSQFCEQTKILSASCLRGIILFTNPSSEFVIKEGCRYYCHLTNLPHFLAELEHHPYVSDAARIFLKNKKATIPLQ